MCMGMDKITYTEGCANYGKNFLSGKLVPGKGKDDCALRPGRRRFDPCLMEMENKSPNWSSCTRFNKSTIKTK